MLRCLEFLQMRLLVEMCQRMLKPVRDSGVLNQAILTYVLILTSNAAVEANDTHNFASWGLSRSMFLKRSALAFCTMTAIYEKRL